MPKHGIRIYGRIKPTKRACDDWELQRAEDDLLPSEGDAKDRVTFRLPRDAADGYINNKKEAYKFNFHKIFPPTTTQEQVFDEVARPVADSALEGYNGTIFAYGQTGSGKTFTITGGAERYADRGIIPRTLSYLFQRYSEMPDQSFTTSVSYLEIYNENGYDLLNPNHEIKKMEDLPKVTLMEDTDGGVHLRNISEQVVNSEEEALSALFMGDTNRMIAETPMNMASTRSHCVFTIYITSRQTGSAVIRKSKLHLVDLAGSERVGKTGVEGTLLTEAKYINLSLMFLEQVIVALSERSRTHIPYRNSMMTSVLRDSLGGNSMTTMIATMSVEKKNLDESISTCRFAQRVAMIKNEVNVNEETDPKLMIARLKQEIVRLKSELAIATGQEGDAGPLTEEELDSCAQAVENYLQDSDPDAQLVLGDMRKIIQCFRILKTKVNERPKTAPMPAGEESLSRQTPAPLAPADAVSDLSSGEHEELQTLRALIRQRDSEISILVAKLKKERALRASGASSGGISDSSSRGTVQVADGRHGGTRGAPARPGSSDILASTAPHLSDQERKAAFEQFRAEYKESGRIDKQKQQLKGLYAKAKLMGEKVNGHRTSINSIKAGIEQHRVNQAVSQISESVSDVPMDAEEVQLRAQLEQEKSEYKSALAALKELKHEIEHLQHLLETAKESASRDSGRSSLGAQSRSARSSASGGAASAKSAAGGGARVGDPSVDDDIEAFFRARDSLRP